MSIPVWNIKSWAPVPTGLQHWRQSIKGLRPLGAAICTASAQECVRGQVLWGGDVDDSPVGIAWEWVRLRANVVVMADPLQVVTNLALLDDDSGQLLSAGQRLCHVNWAIHTLPWQEAVCAGFND